MLVRVHAQSLPRANSPPNLLRDGNIQRIATTHLEINNLASGFSESFCFSRYFFGGVPLSETEILDFIAHRAAH